jgi:hypothetical protein
MFAVYSRYNYLQLIYDDNKNAQSNAPVDAGFTFSYKNMSLGFGIGIPFTYSRDYPKSAALDIQLNYCNDYFYGEASFKYYNGFHNDFDFVDLKLLSGGFLGEYILDKNHSLRSVYRMDRLQTVPNGSFLLGWNLFITSIDSDDIHYYQNKKDYLYFGPSMGYSYTWVLKNNYFINAFLVIGPDLCVEYDASRYFFTPQLTPKISIGKHNNSWSLNFETKLNYISFSPNFSFSDALLSASACMTISKRF